MKYNPEWKVAVITADFNPILTNPLKEGAVNKLKESGIKTIEEISVPGALELPLAAQWALQKNFDAVVALGVVIRGETAHFDYVCNGAERGCSQVQLATGKPVAFGVLTTENRDQVRARTIGRKGHKGAEASEVVLEMLSLKQRLKV